ncbi:transketolase [Candidatus Uhrbacteria bacterium]|jgi:transketolase|nr:transketolase [Candidatus Uhrbacteria bacterium]MBT7716823.1 transketolase [Candidatus Uhrbacteria bacterium]
MPPVRDIKQLSEKKLFALEKRARDIRVDLLTMLEAAGSGHSAGPLGLADIFTALYFHVLVHNPKKPNMKDRDRLILSCGHTVPIRYTAMAHAGYFPKSELATLRQFGSRLQGHPEMTHLPGLESTSGPLGDGSPQAAGLAYIAKQEKLPWHTYCVMSDGELQAGITWEAALFAGRNTLHNMTWIIDRNNIQIDGYTEDIMPLEPLVDKFEAFNFHVIEVDGHNIREIVDACAYAQSIYEQPCVIIAHTTPGKGVDFMEFEPIWHGKPPKDKAELKRALTALRTLNGKIKAGE